MGEYEINHDWDHYGILLTKLVVNRSSLHYLFLMGSMVMTPIMICTSILICSSMFISHLDLCIFCSYWVDLVTRYLKNFINRSMWLNNSSKLSYIDNTSKLVFNIFIVNIKIKKWKHSQNSTWTNIFFYFYMLKKG